MAQELPSLLSLAHHRSTAPVVAFLCAARGKEERHLHGTQLENLSVLRWQGPSALLTPFRLCAFPSVVRTSPSSRRRGRPAG